MAIPSTRVHTDAVIAAVETVGRPVGDGRTPDDPGAVYYIVEPMTAGLDEPLSGGHIWSRFAYHVKSVAVDRQGAERARDWARDVMLGSQMTVPGRVVVDVDLETSSGLVRDDDVRERPMWWVSDRFVVLTEPS